MPSAILSLELTQSQILEKTESNQMNEKLKDDGEVQVSPLILRVNEIQLCMNPFKVNDEKLRLKKLI